MKNSLIEYEKDKVVITDLKAENENMLNVIDELKIRMQRYLEEMNIANENFEAIKNVNKELQNTVEKLQKETEEK